MAVVISLLSTTSIMSAYSFDFKIMVPPDSCEGAACDTVSLVCQDSCQICNPINPFGVYPVPPYDSICRTRNFVRELYIPGSSCLAIVYLRVRKCLNNCGALDNCQLSIDSVIVPSAINTCLSCAIPFNAAGMKLMLRSIEEELVKTQIFQTPCGINPPLPNSQYAYQVGKSPCWKKETRGGGLTGLPITNVFKPCRVDICCLSKYCVTIDSSGVVTVALCDKKTCPDVIESCALDGNGNPVSACTDAWFICD